MEHITHQQRATWNAFSKLVCTWFKQLKSKITVSEDCPNALEMLFQTTSPSEGGTDLDVAMLALLHTALLGSSGTKSKRTTAFAALAVYNEGKYYDNLTKACKATVYLRKR